MIALDWLPGSFYRKPDWRWRRAKWLYKHRKRIDRRIDDDWVVRARQHLRDQDLAEDCRRRRKPSLLDQNIQATLTIQKQTLPYGRWQLEALLLTDESFPAIAKRCELPADILAVYDALFFDVRSRLRAKDWIMMRVLGGGPWNNFAGADEGMLWKFFAYIGGPKLLEVIMAVTMQQPLPLWLRRSFHRNPAYEETLLRVKVKLLLGLLTAQSPDAFEACMQLYRKVRSADVKSPKTVEDRRLKMFEDLLVTMQRGRAPKTVDPIKKGKRSREEQTPAADTRTLLADLFQFCQRG